MSSCSCVTWKTKDQANQVRKKTSSPRKQHCTADIYLERQAQKATSLAKVLQCWIVSFQASMPFSSTAMAEAKCQEKKIAWWPETESCKASFQWTFIFSWATATSKKFASKGSCLQVVLGKAFTTRSPAFSWSCTQGYFGDGWTGTFRFERAFKSGKWWQVQTKDAPGTCGNCQQTPGNFEASWLLHPLWWLWETCASKHNYQQAFQASLLPRPDDIKAFWKLQENHPAWNKHPISKRSSSKCVPLLLHGDGTPVISIGKLWSKQLTIFSWTSMLGSGLTKDTLFHIWSVIDRSATAATWDAFFEQLAWSFNILWQGVWPSADAKGNKYPPGSPEALKSGRWFLLLPMVSDWWLRLYGCCPTITTLQPEGRALCPLPMHRRRRNQ